jgi:hypothetical protein
MPDFESDLGHIANLDRLPSQIGPFKVDEDDFLLATMLQDEVLAPEIMWDDPKNHDYGGAYRVQDFQYPLFRRVGNEAIYACARSVGKSESSKAKAFTHLFKRHAENLLITAPELIHLLPLTQAVEERIWKCRLTRESLDTRQGKTGFTHRPFGVDFDDGTKIIGRIPGKNAMGVKGMHQPDLIVDEGQDYADRAYVELDPTLMRDHTDADGNPDFHYDVYGVHSGNNAGTFHRLTKGGSFRHIRITAMQRPGWSAKEKESAKSMFGGTDSSDYRRNILGEAGGTASAYFVMSRLMACVDQGDGMDPSTSKYNSEEYRHIEITQEQLDEAGDSDDDVRASLAALMDIPAGYSTCWAGADIGLTESPTEILIASEEKVAGEPRLKVIRRLTLRRFREKAIRWAFYEVDLALGRALKGFGMDTTGIGFPIRQAMEDDGTAPPHLMQVMTGYFFNSPVPIAVDKSDVTEDDDGRMKDRYGNAVKVEQDDWGTPRLVTYQPMIEASTRFIRGWVDVTFLLLPFDIEIINDMTLETVQRVRKLAGVKKKPQALHTLDAMRVMAMVRESRDIEADLSTDVGEDVIDIAVEW